jgi:hypothetical protein
MEKLYERCGRTAPRFYVETKWKSPVEELRKASKAFPELVFHVGWMRLQDMSGEYVMQDGDLTESVVRNASWYLFDNLRYPVASLLPAQMGHTLAQHAALRVGDAIQTLEDIQRVLDDRRFTDSPYQRLRNARRVRETRAALDTAIEQMKNSAKLMDCPMDWEGVFLDGKCREEAAEKKLPDFIGDRQPLVNEVVEADAVAEEPEKVGL